MKKEFDPPIIEEILPDGGDILTTSLCTTSGFGGENETELV